MNFFKVCCLGFRVDLQFRDVEAVERPALCVSLGCRGVQALGPFGFWGFGDRMFEEFGVLPGFASVRGVAVLF